MKKIVLLAFVLMLLSTAVVVRFITPVAAQGTIYIRADGSVEGTDKIQRDGNVYTFTGNIDDEIVVERGNIIVDGNGYTVQGAGAGVGFTLGGNNVTIKNTVITGFDTAGSEFAAAVYSLNTLNNIITDNTITSNKWGINLEWVTGYVISGNDIVSQSQSGIYLRESRNNVISNNDISNNQNGITLASDSNNNKIYHNNFINNISPGFAVNSDNNIWDDGYPSGGNYWSDYEEKYPDAQEIDGSGIWDTPYVFDGNNIDNYPLVPEFPTWTSVILILIVLTVAIAIYKRKLLKTQIH